MTSSGMRSSAERRVPLPQGRTLLVRPLGPSDVDALATLYSQLSEDDLYRRFFQAHVPPRSALEHMAQAEARGDIALLAELVEPGGRRQVVGEAACARLPDGDGELGLTVTPSARGWTGPYLLDVLCDIASSRGIANLQADILLDNRSMLALVQRRGYATMDHSTQPALVRVVFSTSGPVPTWRTRHGCPRVLVEAPGARWPAEEAARAAGMDVLVCPGPQARWSRCPAVRGRRCPLAAEADVIVVAPTPGSDTRRQLLQEHRSLHGDRLVYLPAPARPGSGPGPVLEAGGPPADPGGARVVYDLRRLLDGRGLAGTPISAHKMQ
jgi:hypothetical protein